MQHVEVSCAVRPI